jgi:hypothetical protein
MRNERQHWGNFSALERHMIGKEKRGGKRYPRARLEESAELPGEQRQTVQHGQKTCDDQGDSQH